MDEKTSNAVFGCIGLWVALFVVSFLVNLLFAYPAMWLWNWLMPTLFDLPMIDVWQAFGLMMLSYFLLPKASSNSSSKS